MFINSVSRLHDVEITCKMYADDVKLYMELTCDSGIDKLQKSLDEVSKWAALWQLPISLTKCTVLTLNPKKGEVEPVLFLDKCKLATVLQMKDLGITIDFKLKFNAHIDKIVGKARSRASLIFRSFKSRNRNNLFQAFVVYVRPLLEYCSVVWSPHYKYAIEKLESVQRRFTKRLPGLSCVEYNNRLLLLNTTSLEHRRLVADLVMLYKIVFDVCDCDLKCKLIFKTDVVPTRGNPYKLKSITARCDIDKYRFINRTVAVWNTLPPSVVKFNSLKSFKSSVIKANLHIYPFL